MDEKLHDLKNEWANAQDKSSSEGLTCNPEEYHEYIKEFDLSEQEEIKLLQTLWSIMNTFVDLGFGVDSIQFLNKVTARPEKAEAEKQKQEIHDSSEILLPHE